MRKSRFFVTSAVVLLVGAVCLASYYLVNELSGPDPSSEGNSSGSFTSSADDHTNISATSVSNIVGDAVPAVHDGKDSIALLTAHKYAEFREHWKALDEKARLEHTVRNAGAIISVWENVIQKDTDYVLYSVREGDSFVSIARQFQQKSDRVVTYGAVKFFNGYTTNTLKPYINVRIPNGEFSVLISREHFSLFLLYNSIPVKSCKIGIGKDEATPAGEFEIGTKAAKPIWYSPKESEYKGEIIPYGDARNILGTHWLSLDHPRHKSLGIHGTNDPSSIGENSSRGCIRLANGDVAELYEILPPGAKVVIQ